jgi:hypothetical protein
LLIFGNHDEPLRMDREARGWEIKGGTRGVGWGEGGEIKGNQVNEIIERRLRLIRNICIIMDLKPHQGREEDDREDRSIQR